MDVITSGSADEKMVAFIVISIGSDVEFTAGTIRSGNDALSAGVNAGSDEIVVWGGDGGLVVVGVVGTGVVVGFGVVGFFKPTTKSVSYSHIAVNR